MLKNFATPDKRGYRKLGFAAPSGSGSPIDSEEEASYSGDYGSARVDCRAEEATSESAHNCRLDSSSEAKVSTYGRFSNRCHDSAAEPAPKSTC
jgi:hypothetical protein